MFAALDRVANLLMAGSWPIVSLPCTVKLVRTDLQSQSICLDEKLSVTVVCHGICFAFVVTTKLTLLFLENGT